MKYGIIQLTDQAYLGFSKAGNSIDLKAPNSLPASYVWTFPSALPGSTQALAVSTTGQLEYVTLGGGGSVTSVALSLPSIFSVSGSPITTSGTLSASLVSQSANTFFAAPSGAADSPSFRAIVWNDVASLVGTSASSFAAGNDARLHSPNTDTGTTQTSFQINSSATGPRIKNTGGVAEFRNAADTAFASVRVGDLFVTGTTTTVNSETLTVADNIIELNSNVTTGTPTEDLGIVGRRGAQTSASLKFNESSDTWSAGLEGTEKQIARVYDNTFTSADLVGGVYTAVHNLNVARKVVQVTIADNNGEAIAHPDKITYSTANQCLVDLTSFGAISGTWTIICVG